MRVNGEREGLGGKKGTEDLSDLEASKRDVGKARAMGALAARGAAWMIGLSVASKLIGLIGQMILARLLTNEDFGLYFLAITIPAVTAIIAQPGIKQVLIERESRFDRWKNPGFWMSLNAGVLGAVLTLLFTPFAVGVFGGGTQLTLMMFVISATMLVTAAGTVAEAKMQIDLRFRAIAFLGAGSAVGTVCLSALMAWWGWGAMSFVIPNFVAAVARTVGMWAITRPAIRWNMEVGRWRYLMVDTGYMVVTQVMLAITARADAAILGVMFAGSKDVVGQYFFAMILGLQTAQLLAFNLSGVLFATLNKLKEEPERQTAAFIRALRVLMLVSVPASIAQAAVAAPLTLLIGGPKWEGAINAVMILSAGSAFGMLSSPAISMLQAQGRFNAVMKCSAVSALTFVLVVWAAAAVSDTSTVTQNVAVGVSLCWGLSGILWVRVAAGRSVAWGAIASIAVVPMATGLVSGTAGWATAAMFGPSWWEMVLACMAGATTTLIVYLVLLRSLGGRWYGELMTVAARFLPGKIKKLLIAQED